MDDAVHITVGCSHGEGDSTYLGNDLVVKLQVESVLFLRDTLRWAEVSTRTSFFSRNSPASSLRIACDQMRLHSLSSFTVEGDLSRLDVQLEIWLHVRSVDRKVDDVLFSAIHLDCMD